MRARGTILAAALALSGCAEGVTSESGLDAWLRPNVGQFLRGDMPQPSGGPAVASLSVLVNDFAPGEIAYPFGGTVDPDGTAAAFALAGDAGYWVVPAGLPDAQAPDYPTYAASLSFSSETPLGDRALLVRAVDAEGRFGETTLKVLTAVAEALAPAPMRVTLRWDTESDLDLRVTDADGIQIWKRNINSWQPPPPGTPPDPTAWMTGAILDGDSNADCTIDGRREESVSWPTAPAAGHYEVKVDAFSLCEQPDARWTVTVAMKNALLAHASGLALPTDTQISHDVDGGFFVLGFDVP